jgi:hypothetical protein
MQMRITYPELDFDGELHVDLKLPSEHGKGKRVEVAFTIAMMPGESPEQAVRRAASDIATKPHHYMGAPDAYRKHD